jgi:predicted dehydrogenase
MEPNRRTFLQSTAAAAATTALALDAKTYAQAPGANERIGIAFLGVGGRCQQHIDVILAMQRENNRNVVPVAVCDVWDGDAQLGRRPDGGFNGRGLFPSARRCGLNVDDRVHVNKDYRRILELREVDAVCIATPDHWHARMCIDAANAHKHIYCEKPMTKTIHEAHAVVDAARRNNVVMTVGVQWMADPSLRRANEMIRRGDIGHVAQAQTSYYRNSLVGQWRYYPLTTSMNPTTIDWDMFLGHRFHVEEGVPLSTPRPFDRALYAQWRCYWDFGGGMFTDLFVHRVTRLISAMGVRYPARVVGGGGLYLEYDGRDVPDVATIVADYEEGCQLVITATMINDYPIEEVIRGRSATVKFGSKPIMRNGMPAADWGYDVIPQTAANRPAQGRAPQGDAVWHGGGMSESDSGRPLWENFLACVRANNRETFCTPDLGAAAFTTVNMGVQSYRQGKVLFWDREHRRPADGDASWATRLERRSHERGQPTQIAGWTGGTRGSTLEPPEYQRLAGPWTNGVDPARPAGATGTGN